MTRKQPGAAAKPFTVTQYVPETHGAFVRSTWALGALRDGSRAARMVLDGYLARPGSRCLVVTPRGSDRLVAWAARTTDALVFAYVLPVMRGRRLANLLLDALRFPERPIPLLHWTPSSQELAAAGVGVYHAVYPVTQSAEEAVA